MRARRDWLVGSSLGLAFFVLYLLTFCRTVFWYDSAEYATAGAVLGIPHPPGYPLYTLFAHVFTWLPMQPATAVNLMSSVFAALAVALTFGLARELGASRLAAACGATALGACSLFWSQALIAEVYTPAAAALTGVTWLVIRGRNRDRYKLVIAGAFVCGLALGLHLSIATCGLGLAFLVASFRCHSLRQVFSKHELVFRAKLASASALAAFAGSLIFLYLPLRARMDPILNFGDPSNMERFFWHITGGNYKNWFGVDASERANDLGAIFFEQLGIVGLLLVVVGMVVTAKRNSIIAVSLAAMIVGNVYTFFDYRVHDFEVFFIPTLCVLFWLVCMGAEETITQLRARLGPERARLSAIAIGVLVLFPLAMIPANYSSLDLSDFDDAEKFGDALVESLPENSVIVNFTTPPEWKADAVFGFYYQKVLRKRLDVRVTKGPPPPQVIIGLLRSGVAVYLYHPVDPILEIFRVVAEGPMYRITEPRPRPERKPR